MLTTVPLSNRVHTPIQIFLQLLQILQIFKLSPKKLQVQVRNRSYFSTLTLCQLQKSAKTPTPKAPTLRSAETPIRTPIAPNAPNPYTEGQRDFGVNWSWIGIGDSI